MRTTDRTGFEIVVAVKPMIPTTSNAALETNYKRLEHVSTKFVKSLAHIGQGLNDFLVVSIFTDKYG